MSYTALYRKFRPDNFKDVKGQEHIVTTLKNQIMAERIGHAYLFCGTRGTGKTTLAKLLAKTVNCENPQDGNPCGVCPSCKAIAAGASMNVIEIDAASNNGVDNIRQIVEEVSYSPAEGKYKVYIIDEAHMITNAAFNALLKTLEEPPSYVIFIFATTEVQSIPITILSRCQRYDFKRITIQTIVDRLQELMAIEQMEVEEKALRYIAKTADGSMRDALSLLDQCLAFHYGEVLTYEKVLEVLGALDTKVFSDCLNLILDANVTGVIKLLDEIILQGRELPQFVTDFVWYLRSLMLAKTSDNIEEVVDMSRENILALQETANRIELQTILRYIRVFSELSNQIKFATQKRVLVEIAFIKLCVPAMEKQDDSILERVRDLERKMEDGVLVARTQDASQPTAQEAKPPVVLPTAIPEDIKQVVSRWPSIAGMADGALKSVLKTVKLSLGGDNQLVMVVEDGYSSDLLQQEENVKEVERLIAEAIEKEVKVIVQVRGQNEANERDYVDLFKMINIEIEEE